MRKVKILLIIITIIVCVTMCGCSNLFDNLLISMDRTSIHYEGHQFNALLNWEMTEPDNYIKKIINNDNINLSIRLYKNDKNTDFIYCEDDSLLYHKAESDLPENKKDIEYLILGFIDRTLELKIRDSSIIKEFNSLILQNSYSNIKRDNNIASLVIYYKNYPACYFYGNIVDDKQGAFWIELSDSEKYLKLDSNSKLLSEIKQNI